ncbi:MAG: ATP-binding cassette domain-containing protein [Pseudomonadota bacterium]|nr:ATP-binding cassette domain-containing protein [Pseudomonadota bacterium]
MADSTNPARHAGVDQADREAVIRIRGLGTVFDDRVIHEDIDLDIYRGEVLALVGGSGSGKSTLLQEIIMLQVPDSGSIKLFGMEVVGISEADAQQLRARFGVLFQEGALFSSLTVLENVGVPLQEHTRLGNSIIRELAMMKIVQAGLKPEAAHLYPSELSGGMVKRAALARAMTLDPEILFLDEPTSGLDPVSAAAFDELVLSLKELMGLTVMMVTHDLDTLWETADRVAVLGDNTLQGVDTMESLSRSTQPRIREYFEGPRAGRARERAWETS